MTGEEEKLLREFLTDRGEIEVVDDDDGFADWYALRSESQETDNQYKRALETAHIWLNRYTIGWRQGYNEGYSRALADEAAEPVLLPAHHLEDCAGPGCGRPAAAGVTRRIGRELPDLQAPDSARSAAPMALGGDVRPLLCGHQLPDYQPAGQGGLQAPTSGRGKTG